MARFYVGQKITFGKEHWNADLHGKEVIVIKVENVPPHLIQWNPETEEGGAGHEQWVWIDATSAIHKDINDGPYSGIYFEKDPEEYRKVHLRKRRP